MTLPVNTPTEFTVAKVEVKKTLAAKDDKPAATVLKLGLVAPDGTKVWPAEFYCRDGTTPPGEGSKETLVLKRGDYGLECYRPRSNKGGRGGGTRQKTPEEVAAERASIEAQVCLKAAVDVAQGDITVLTGAAEKAAEALKAAKEILR